jgi:predicted transcriptional regulator with HTH domain
MLTIIRIQYAPVYIAILCLLNWNNSAAQTATPQQIMANIYKAYDSLQYLSFNIKYTYTSDTVNGNFTNDMLQGAYTIAGKKSKFNLGDIEFIQNDSFFITVYNDDKYILVADPRHVNTGSELPMRQTIDSLIGAYQQHYDYSYSYVNDDDSSLGLAQLGFKKADSIAQFEKFSITYDTAQNVLHSIEYIFSEPVIVETDQSIINPPAPQATLFSTKRLRIEFSAYRFENFSDSVYDESQYIFFEDDVCKPVSKYKDYKIFYSRLGLTNTVEPPDPQ